MPYKKSTKLGQFLCHHEYQRMGHDQRHEHAIWFCKKCGKEISVECPVRNQPEAVCSVCGRPLSKYEEACPEHPCSAAVLPKARQKGAVR